MVCQGVQLLEPPITKWSLAKFLSLLEIKNDQMTILPLQINYCILRNKNKFQNIGKYHKHTF